MPLSRNADAKHVNVAAVIRRDQRNAIEEIAQDEGRSKSKVIRKLLDDGLAAMRRPDEVAQ